MQAEDAAVLGRAMQRLGMAETGGGVRIRNWMRARLPPAEEALEGFRSPRFVAVYLSDALCCTVDFP